MAGIHIIALLGASGSGKSEAAKRLQGMGFARVRFAEPLKDMLKAMGLSELDVDGPQEHRTKPHPLLLGKSPRYAMQTLGTEWRNYIGRDLWATITLDRVKTMIANGYTRIVIDDMRFPHEQELFADIGLVTVAIRRPEAEASGRSIFVSKLPRFLRPVASFLLQAPALHASEALWYDMRHDVIIPNTGTLEDLFDYIDLLPEQIDFLSATVFPFIYPFKETTGGRSIP